jgi:molybdopterin-containing oxidoreductase family iron-sulfur binding subunit
MIPLPLTDDAPANRPPEYWRSLAERDGMWDAAAIAPEFPPGAPLLDREVDRRKFVGVMGASLALAGTVGCGRQAPEKIVPHIKAPEQVVPGRPLFFATAMPQPGGAVGLIVESHEGRPTKIEGNPAHPASLGAAGAVEQAAVLDLYDPDRAHALTHLGRVTGWNDALDQLRKELGAMAARKGAGFALLTGAINSPTLAAQIDDLLKKLPQAKWFVHEPAVPAAPLIAAKEALGRPADVLYRIADADVIVALDADFLSTGPNHLRHAREFAARRDPAQAMNRLYAIESMPSPTGFAADHRVAERAGQIESWASALAAKLGLPVAAPQLDERQTRVVAAMAADLQKAGPRGLVIAGPYQPVAVHLLAYAINQKLGSVGTACVFVPPTDARPIGGAGLPDLARAIDAREVDTLLILSVNPVHTAPAGIDFAALLEKVRLKIRLGYYEDETGSLCDWHIPEAHFLESWSDATGPDGTASIIQPLIAPLFEGKTAHEVIEAFANAAITRPAETKGPATEWKPWRAREIVRDYWRGWHAKNKVAEPFDKFWRKAVHDGVVAGTSAAPLALTGPVNLTGLKAPSRPAAAGFELIIRPDPVLLDGRFANNGWLQELPKPLTKLAWENAAVVSPATAKALGIATREGPRAGNRGELITEVVELTLGQKSVRAPAYILPGHPDQSVTLHLGYGRAKTGTVANGVGVNANLIRPDEQFWQGGGLEVRPTRVSATLACPQMLWSMEGRDLVRVATLAEYAKDPSCQPHHGDGHGHGHGHHNPHVEGFDELYTNPETGGPYQWGMAVDLGSCIGCGACVVACQAENSLPVVGKEEVTRGRDMAWMRVDRYFTEKDGGYEAVHQPVMCMHCENAPCEVVCPVEATSHSPDGLNEMTYNRCVGTRYCANNCPYKTRRFNFLEYADFATESLKLQRNPDVSVRVRGVMEKCTYCVQRIRGAGIDSKVSGKPIADGDVVTACQAACPSQAIIFGNVADPNSRVSKAKALPRNYGLLTELNTKPRTTYLAAVRNPNPELV